jgi:hypothetical protein
VAAEEEVTWTDEVTYRGQRTETQHRAVRFHATVGRAGAEALLASLSRFRLRAVEVED